MRSPLEKGEYKGDGKRKRDRLDKLLKALRFLTYSVKVGVI